MYIITKVYCLLKNTQPKEYSIIKNIVNVLEKNDISYEFMVRFNISQLVTIFYPEDKVIGREKELMQTHPYNK